MRIAAAITLLVAILLSACSPGIDRKKFVEVKKDAEEISRAIEKLADYGEFARLVERFDLHAKEAEPLMATEREKRLFREYAELLARYREVELFWRYKVGSYQYDWIPKGRVYVDPELRPVIVKYGFKTEQHLIQLTGHRWESVSVEDLKVLLLKAKEQYEKAKKG